MKPIRHPASCPAPLATLPPRGSFPTLTFSMARILTFSVAIDTVREATFRRRPQRLAEPRLGG